MARHEEHIRQRAAEVRTRRDSGFQLRKRLRQQERTHALTERIHGLLVKLQEREVIADHVREGRLPHEIGISTTFFIRRVDGQERRFVCTNDFRLARLVAQAPRQSNDPKITPIVVTPEMRDARIIERITLLFAN